MTATISRRLAALEARHRPIRQSCTFVVMPWDVEPDARPDDMVMTVAFVRPTDQPGGEVVPYLRTGLHPSQDDPASPNGQLYRAAADAQPWRFQQFKSGSSIYMPDNGREPMEGQADA